MLEIKNTVSKIKNSWLYRIKERLSEVEDQEKLLELKYEETKRLVMGGTQSTPRAEGTEQKV